MPPSPPDGDMRHSTGDRSARIAMRALQSDKVASELASLPTQDRSAGVCQLPALHWILRALRKRCAEGSRLGCCTVPLPASDPLTWCRAHSPPARFYMSRRTARELSRAAAGPVAAGSMQLGPAPRKSASFPAAEDVNPIASVNAEGSRVVVFGPLRRRQCRHCCAIRARAGQADIRDRSGSTIVKDEVQCGTVAVME